MTLPTLVCKDEERRSAVRRSLIVNGLDYLEVGEDQQTLQVYFLRKAPQVISKENIQIVGAHREREIREREIKVISIHVIRPENPDLVDCMEVKLDRYGDFSTYQLRLIEIDAITKQPVYDVDEQGQKQYRPMVGFDKHYVTLDFNFKIDCAQDLDCKSLPCTPKHSKLLLNNYLAKDYASFQRLIYDRLAELIPDWQEKLVPDLGVTLVELLAYVGDHLSYYQDAVATEAYLNTARQRISVRRHARLVNYQLHEGCNARALVFLKVSQDIILNANDFYFTTAPTRVNGSLFVYEPMVINQGAELKFYAAHNEIAIYTWEDNECCLPKGATAATLLDPGQGEYQLKLQKDDLLIFEEIKGITTGNVADADITHRHVVRLTKVTPSKDHLLEHLVVEIEWALQDALPFDLHLSSIKAGDCSLITQMSVARGNLLLVDHGERVEEPLPVVPGTIALSSCEKTSCGLLEGQKMTDWYRPKLNHRDLTFSQPFNNSLSTHAMMTQDVCEAQAQVKLKELESIAPLWNVRSDLLASSAGDRHFVVEIDNNRQAELRFGDNRYGNCPEPATQFLALYRVGNGPIGNVGAEAIQSIQFRNNLPQGVEVVPRNPLPAQGGLSPESMVEAKLLAPHKFRQVLERAIIPEDYAKIVMRDFSQQVQKSAATFRWTGSWYEVLVAIDPLDAIHAKEGLLAEIYAHLVKYKRIGHDLQVILAYYVPLELHMQICVSSDYFRSHVLAALLEVFSNQRLADGSLGFFHPDQLSFGQGIYLSQLIAKAQAVTGVRSVTVTQFKRLFESSAYEIENGILPLGPMEIARLDNDPNFPENGKLFLQMVGGR